jgi:hypothetical protein
MGCCAGICRGCATLQPCSGTGACTQSVQLGGCINERGFFVWRTQHKRSGCISSPMISSSNEPVAGVLAYRTSFGAFGNLVIIDLQSVSSDISASCFDLRGEPIYCCWKTWASTLEASATQRKPTVPARSYPASNKRYLAASVRNVASVLIFYITGKFCCLFSGKTKSNGGYIFSDILVVGAQPDAMPEIPVAARWSVIATALQKLAARVPIAVRVGKLLQIAQSDLTQHLNSGWDNACARIYHLPDVAHHVADAIDALAFGVRCVREVSGRMPLSLRKSSARPQSIKHCPALPSTRSGGGGSASEFCNGV